MESYHQKLPINSLLSSPYQPESRIGIDPVRLNRLVDSIRTQGLIQEIVVRPAPSGSDKFEVADGWLRVVAFRRLAKDSPEYQSIPACVRELSNQQMADMIIEANTVRHDLTPIDLAKFYVRYMADFHLTQAKLAEKYNVSQGEIANTIRLLDLLPEVQRRIISREISESHARTLLQLKDNVLMVRLCEECSERQMTVAQLDARVKEVIRQQKPRLDGAAEEVTPGGAAAPPPPAPGPADSAPSKTESRPPSSTVIKPPASPPAVEKKGPPATKPEPKPPLSKPQAISPWKRKIVIEEKEGFVQVSVMREGAFPVQQRVEDLYGALQIMLGLLEKAEAQWKKETK